MATKKSAIVTKLKGTEKNQALVEVVINAKVAEEARQEALRHMGQSITIKGFRQGKAPANLVERELDPQKVLEHAISHLLPEILTTALQENNLKPLSNPRIHLVEAKRDADWKFELDVPLQPDFETKGFQNYLKGELAASAIWTPDKGEKPDEKADPEKASEEKLKKLIDTLLKKYTFEVPPMLVEDEINRSLARLLNQIETLNLKLEDYLKSIGKSAEQLREEYQKSATENLRLEIILARLGHELKIEVPKEEIDAMIAGAGDEATRKKLDTAEQRQYIKGILEKRKTIDALISL